MSTILLHHGGKTTTPFADAPVKKRLAELEKTFKTPAARCSVSTSLGGSLAQADQIGPADLLLLQVLGCGTVCQLI